MRENAPVYYDEQRDVWGITRHADVLAIEKDPKTFSSKFSPRPHGGGLPMKEALLELEGVGSSRSG